MNDSFESRFDELNLTIESTKKILQSLLNSCRKLTNETPKSETENTIQNSFETIILLYSYVLEMEQLLFFFHEKDFSDLNDFMQHCYANPYEKQKHLMEEELYGIVKNLKDISLGNLYKKAVDKYYECFLHITSVYHSHLTKQLQEYINAYQSLCKTKEKKLVIKLQFISKRMMMETEFYDGLLYQLTLEDIYDDSFLEEKSLFSTVTRLNHFAQSISSF